MKLSTIINSMRIASTRGFQAAINNLSDGYVNQRYFPIVENIYGYRFYHTHTDDLVDILDQYVFMPDHEDIVFDIGAFLGGFTVPALKRAKKVYAFEPLYFRELVKNVTLNDYRNVCVAHELALGNGNPARVEYFKVEDMPTATFQQMKVIAGDSPTFLKCNCEGAEWGLKPHDFEGIETIEIQFHYSDAIERSPILDWLTEAYECTTTCKPATGINGIYQTVNIHGKLKHH